MTRERLYVWDNLKFMLIVLVVLGHFLGVLGNASDLSKRVYLCIYSFHMPLFVFISGVFSEKIPANRDRTINKLALLLWMYLFIKAWTFVSSSLFNGSIARFSLLDASGMEWYPLALIYARVMTAAVARHDERFVLVVSIAFACLIGYDPTLTDTLACARCIVFFPFYYLGSCLGPRSFERIQNRFSKGIAIALITIFFSILCIRLDDLYWLRIVFSAHNPYNTFGDYGNYGGIIRCIWYLVSILLCLAFIAVFPNRRLRISKWGSATLPIFVFHGTLIYVCKALLASVPKESNLCVLLACFMSVGIVLVLGCEPIAKALSIPLSLPNRYVVPPEA